MEQKRDRRLAAYMYEYVLTIVIVIACHPRLSLI